ncbi:MAG: CHAP domain-containing protein [Bacteroidaceae bacterium]|nr:CHAP domain-containing protein [Bacteroidaceae bacterium]
MTADKILSIAKNELGTVENPRGSNKVKYNTEYYGREVSGSSYPWCCAFVWWVFKQAGASHLFFDGKRTAYCPTLLADYKKKGQTVTSGYKPGDLVFFNFSGGTKAKHIGICVAWDGDYITTIDGNTGSGDEANGGAVMKRKRHKKYVVGVARPNYKAVNTVEVTLDVLRRGDKKTSVKSIQVLLDGMGFPCGKADGSFGAKTEAAVKNYQTAKKLKVDGIVGHATWTSLLGR